MALWSYGREMGRWAVAAGLLLLGGPVLAQAPRPPAAAPAPGAEGRKAERERLRAQIIDQLRAERMWKLTEALKLDEATAARLFPLLSKYDEQERALGQERGQIVRELRDLVDAPNPDQPRISALVDRLVSVRTRRQAMENEKMAAVRRVLTPAQMAKLMLLAPRIDDGFRQRIREAVQTARQAARGNDRGEGRGRRDDLDWP